MIYSTDPYYLAKLAEFKRKYDANLRKSLLRSEFWNLVDSYRSLFEIIRKNKQHWPEAYYLKKEKMLDFILDKIIHLSVLVGFDRSVLPLDLILKNLQLTGKI